MWKASRKTRLLTHLWAADLGQFEAKFVCCDSLGHKDYPLHGPAYDTVTVMFALHYFFQTEASAHQFMRNVAMNLKPGACVRACAATTLPPAASAAGAAADGALHVAGGFFIGTVPDGKRVQQTIHEGSTWPEYNAKLLTLKAAWKGEPAPFGSGYTCAIGDTVTAGAGLQPALLLQSKQLAAGSIQITAVMLTGARLTGRRQRTCTVCACCLTCCVTTSMLACY